MGFILKLPIFHLNLIKKCFHQIRIRLRIIILYNQSFREEKEHFQVEFKISNGYETTEKGINLTVTFSKVDRQHNANVSWDRPTDSELMLCYNYRNV